MNLFAKILSIILFVCFTTMCSAQKKEVFKIYFNSNSYMILSEYIQKLDRIVELCNSENFSYLKIFAYSDTQGAPEHNKLISKKRGYEVLNYLAARANINKDNSYITWLGESTYLYDMHFDEPHAQQRYVEIIVQFKKAKLPTPLPNQNK